MNLLSNPFLYLATLSLPNQFCLSFEAILLKRSKSTEAFLFQELGQLCRHEDLTARF